MFIALYWWISWYISGEGLMMRKWPYTTWSWRIYIPSDLKISLGKYLGRLGCILFPSIQTEFQKSLASTQSGSWWMGQRGASAGKTCGGTERISSARSLSRFLGEIISNCKRLILWPVLSWRWLQYFELQRHCFDQHCYCCSATCANYDRVIFILYKIFNWSGSFLFVWLSDKPTSKQIQSQNFPPTSTNV